MKYPLDVTVLVAWGWSDHVAHEPTVTWIAATSERKASTLLTSATQSSASCGSPSSAQEDMWR